MNARIIFFLFSTLYLTQVFSQKEFQKTYSYDSLYILLEQAQIEKDQGKLADIYYLIAKYEEENYIRNENTLEFYIRAKQYYERIQDTTKIRNVEFHIGQQYAQAGLYKEALQLFQKVRSFYRLKNDSLGLSRVYAHMANLSNLRADNEKAVRLINIALNYSLKIKDTLSYIKYNNIKANYYEQLNELDSALIIAYESFKIGEIVKNQNLKSKSLYHISKLNYKKNDLQKAIKYGLAAEEILHVVDFDEHRKNVYYNLANCYADLDSFEKAHTYLNRYSLLNDSISDKSMIESLNNLTVKHQSDENKKKNEILELEKKYAEKENVQQRYTLYVLLIILGLVLILFYYMIRFYTQKIKNEKIITDQNEEISNQKINKLESELKIKSMESMIDGQEKERERIAQDLHDSLGGMLSSIKLQFENTKVKLDQNHPELNKTSRLLDNAVEEVRNISRNLQPSALARLGLIAALKDLINRYDDDAYPEIFLQYYNMPEDLDNLKSLAIYRVIQELLNNSLKHANANEILIELSKDGEELLVQYEDDGVGFDVEKGYRGLGLENIKSRINYLKASISFDSEKNKGTSVLIHVPL